MKPIILDEFKIKLQPILAEFSLELYDVIYEEEQNETFLRVFLDTINGDVFDLDLCAKVNQVISDMIDAEYDLEEYALDYLEVSSPGAERMLNNLEHYNGAIGEKIYLLVKEPINKEIHIYGDLLEVNEKEIVVNAKFKNLRKKITVSFDDIELAHVSVI